jgi:hypothetical protein
MHRSVSMERQGQTGFHVLNRGLFSTLSRGMDSERPTGRCWKGSGLCHIYKVVDAMSYQYIHWGTGGDRLAIGLVYCNRRAITVRVRQGNATSGVWARFDRLRSADPATKALWYDSLARS